MKNRNGLVVDLVLSQTTGTAEAEAALTMLERVPTTRRITVGADKGYATREFVTTCCSLDITPHVAMKQMEQRRYPALDRRYGSGDGCFEQQSSYETGVRAEAGHRRVV